MSHFPIRTIPQLPMLKRIPKNTLPEIPDEFDLRALIRTNPQLRPLYRDVEDYISHLSEWFAVATSPENLADSEIAYGSRYKMEKFVSRLINAALKVRERCSHHIMFPEAYLANRAHHAMRIYWQITTMLASPDRALYDIELILPNGGISPFTKHDYRITAKGNDKAEFYSLMRAFVYRFPFCYKTDRKIMELYSLGCDYSVIAITLKEDAQFVNKKIKQFVELALANKAEFLKESLEG